MKARLAKRRRKQRNRRRKGTEQKREKEEGEANRHAGALLQTELSPRRAHNLRVHVLIPELPQSRVGVPGGQRQWAADPTACFPLHSEPTMGTCTSQNRSTPGRAPTAQQRGPSHPGTQSPR